jgi:hypothetical protein
MSGYKGDPAAEGIAAAREDALAAHCEERGLHRNLISDDEDEAREDLLAAFESALDDLIADALRQADEVGGYFRGPGIRRQITDLLLDKARSAR